MKILIIEDEQPAAKQLIKLLHKIDTTITVIDTIDSVEASVKWLTNFPMPDAIFMDIQIADGLSFDIFKHASITCPIVFTTAFDQYAIKAFRVNALDYLLKPIDEEELLLVFQKLKKNLSTQINFDFFQNLSAQFQKPIEFKTRFFIKQMNAFGFVEAKDIAYFFSEDSLTQFCTFQNKKNFLETTLDDLENQLDPKSFFRVNRKLILSLASIQKINSHFNGRLKLEIAPAFLDDVFVARERVNDFKKWLGG